MCPYLRHSFILSCRQKLIMPIFIYRCVPISKSLHNSRHRYAYIIRNIYSFFIIIFNSMHKFSYFITKSCSFISKPVSLYLPRILVSYFEFLCKPPWWLSKYISVSTGYNKLSFCLSTQPCLYYSCFIYIFIFIFNKCFCISIHTILCPHCPECNIIIFTAKQCQYWK